MSNPIFTICRNIRKITEEHFKEVEYIGIKQSAWVHPLKGGQQKKINSLGNNNLSIVEHLKAIQGIIKNNKPK